MADENTTGAHAISDPNQEFAKDDPIYPAHWVPTRGSVARELASMKDGELLDVINAALAARRA